LQRTILNTSREGWEMIHVLDEQTMDAVIDIKA